MRIPLAALRRALAHAQNFSADAGRGASIGAAFGGIPAGFEELTDGEPGADVGRVLGGALVGGAVGAGVGGYGGMAARRLLAAAAAKRGGGGAAMAAVDDVDDAARFHGLSREDRTLEMVRASRWAEENGLDPRRFNPDELLEEYQRAMSR